MQWDKNTACVPYKMKRKILFCAKWYNSHTDGRYVSAAHLKQLQHSSKNYGPQTTSNFATCGDLKKKIKIKINK